jgi:hypothetical protein
MTTTQMCVRTVMVGVAVAALSGGTLVKASEPQGRENYATIPVRLDVTLTRYQGEKKISSLPFSLLASAVDFQRSSQPVSIRMGIDVPIGSATTTDSRTVPAGGTGTSTTTTGSTTRIEYRSVGTNIDCLVSRLDETHFSVRVSINDSSIYTPDGDKALKNPDAAAFRTFNASNTVVMLDGQTVQFGTGTDKISGETLKIDVTLKVVK